MKRVNCSPKMSRVGRAGVNERRVVLLLGSNDKFMVSMGLRGAKPSNNEKRRVKSPKFQKWLGL